MPHTTSKYTRKRQRRRPEAGEGPIEEGRTDGHYSCFLRATDTHYTPESIILAGGVGVTTGCCYYCVAGLGNICDQIICIGKALVF